MSDAMPDLLEGPAPAATLLADPAGAAAAGVPAEAAEHGIARFWRRAAGTALTRFAAVPIGLASSILVARALGPTGRGIYGVIVTVGALGVQLGSLGLPSALAHFAAADRRRLPELLGLALACALGLGALLALAVALAGWLVPGLRPLPSPGFMAAAALWIPAGLLVLLLENLLLGLHEVRLFNVLQFGREGLTLLVFGGLVVAGLTTPLSFYGGVYLLLVAFAGIAWRLLRRRAAAPPRLPGRAFLARATGYGGRAYLATLASYLVLNFDLLMVARMLGERQAGYYAIAARMAEMASLLPVAIGSILFVTVSGMAAGRWPFARRTAVMVAVGLLPVLGLAAVLADPVVRLLYGSAYAPAVPAFLWLLPGIYLLSVNGVFANYFAGTGMPLIAVLGPGAAAVLNVLLNLWLLPRLGIAGASIASSIAYGVMLLASLGWIAWRRPA